MGKQLYRVKVGLSYPSDKDIIRQIQAGEKIPRGHRKEKRVEPGDLVCDLPESSIPALLAAGKIEEAGEVIEDG